MVEKQVKISVTTEVDAANVDDLSQKIQELQNSMVNIDFNIDDASISQLSDLVEKVDGENVELHIDTDDGELNEAYALVTDLDGNVTRINFDTDTGSLTEVQEEINKLSDNSVDVKVIADNTMLEDTSDIIDGINNKKISIYADMDINSLETELKKANSEVDNLEKELTNIELGGLDGDFDKVNSELESAKNKVQELESALSFTSNVQVNVEDGELDSAKSKEENLNDTTNVDVDVEDGEIKQADKDIDNLDKTVKVGIELEGMEAVKQGFDSLKNGAKELKDEYGEILSSAGRMEQTESFLSMNLGADEAKKKLTEIRNVTDTLPGDDVALQNLLSQSAIKDLSMGEEQFTQMGNAAADYMAAMQNFGKTSTETQQDLMNYILAGNTAEIERSPILQAHVDKLKEGNTIHERSLLLEEALKEENWAGIASQDIYNNKVQSFNDLLERGKMNLGSMFLEPTKKLMVFIGEMDEASGGLIGMAVAAGSMATPLIDTGAGLGQMAMGMKAVKDLGFIGWLKDLEISTKLAKIANIEFSLSFLTNPIFLVVAAIAALVAILAYLYFNNEQVRQAIDALFNAFKEVVGYISSAVIGTFEWLSGVFKDFTDKLGLNTSDWKQAVYGFILFLPQLPLLLGEVLVNALANALGFKGDFVQTMYQSAVDAVTGFRDALFNIPNAIGEALGFAYESIMNHPFVQGILYIADIWGLCMQSMYDSTFNIVNWIITSLQGLWNYIITLGGLLPTNVNLTGNQIIDTILRVLMFIATLPLQIGMFFTNIIAKALGFGNNFSQRLISAALNAVNGFINKIRELPGMIQSEFGRIEGIVSDFVTSLPSRVWDLGASIVDALKSALGIGSPGHMFYMFEGELNRLKALPGNIKSSIIHNVAGLGTGIVESFNQGQLEFNTKDISLGNELLLNDDNNGNGQTINFYFNDTVVDNEDRMEKICDYITRKLNFNNETAGRGV